MEFDVSDDFDKNLAKKILQIEFQVKIDFLNHKYKFGLAM